MNISRQHLAVIGAVILIAIAAGFFVWRKGPATDEQTSSDTANSSSSDENVAAALDQALTNSTGGDYTIGTVPINAQNRPTTPDYTKPLTFSSSITEQERTALNTQLATVQADIQKDALDFNAWISLGTLNLMAGDYASARAIWEYASAVWPSNYVSYNNLGDLYAHYLKDYPKAEANFLKGIEYKPEDSNPYKNLFTIYSGTSYKPSNTAAEDILKRGIAAVPRAVDLQVLLARYYKSLGMDAQATATYNAAIANAEVQGLTSLAASIRSEMTQ